MRMMLTGFTGWASMSRNRTDSQRVLDTALTVVATLGVAATYAIFHAWV